MMVLPENWIWRDGIGFLPIGDKPVKYNKRYFENYVERSKTAAGMLIDQIRYGMVRGWITKENPILDIGIGCGSFLTTMRHHGWQAYGADVNPWGVAWLEERGWTHEGEEVKAITFWDVLEHIEEPKAIFSQYNPEWIFLSMPIYKDEDHVFKSRHFKPGEHCWYFTQDGLIRFMNDHGYACVEVNKKETVLIGRDDVFSFVFKRI